MCSDKPDVEDLQFVIDANDEPVFVAGDVEHNPSVLQDARGLVLVFDAVLRLPGCPLRFGKPRFERLFSVPVFQPEGSEGRAGNDSHREKIRSSQLGNKGNVIKKKGWSRLRTHSISERSEIGAQQASTGSHSVFALCACLGVVPFVYCPLQPQSFASGPVLPIHSHERSEWLVNRGSRSSMAGSET